MPLRVVPGEDSDALRAAELEREAYVSDPFNDIFFPGPFPPEILNIRGEQLLKERKEDPNTVWMKVVDTDIQEGSQTIAFAKWHIREKAPELKERKWGPGCNAEALNLLFGGLDRLTARYTPDGPHFYLHQLHTNPQHQRRGAGVLLMQRLLEDAAKRGLPVYLHSSEAGHRLYLKTGFRDLERDDVDLTKFGAPRLHRTWAMVAQPE